MKFLLPILAILTLMPSTALLASPATSPECPLPRPVAFKKGSLTIAQGSRITRLQVEVAETPEARGQGLMCRTRLAENAGMLFIFENTSQVGFWMKNTLLPLSIAFIDDAWKIVDMKDMDVEQDPTAPVKTYPSAKPYRYALEVNQGFFARHGITAGARVTYRPQP